MLSPRFEQALHYATLIHAGQLRKGSDIPYISHLLGVASIAMEHGADEDEAIGALLHDAGEDAGGQGRIEDIRLRFGDRVAEIVAGCTDTVETPKPEWRGRKEAYIRHLPQASPSTRLVSAADKLYNAQSILREYRRRGESVWTKFQGRKEGTLWYYRALLAAFRETAGDQHGMLPELVEELDRVVTELERLARLVSPADSRRPDQPAH